MNKETHESYGLLKFSRTSGAKRALFGSSIPHGDTITLTLSKGAIERDLSSDFYYNEGKLAEVEMSFAQFAEAISSMNIGEGVPVTIKWLRGEGILEDCPFTSKQEQFEKEFNDNMDNANEKANDIIKTVTKMFEEKKSLNKGDKETILNQLEMLAKEINENRDFIYRQFNEQMEKTTIEAKGEIEAYAQRKIYSIATMAIQDRAAAMKELDIDRKEEAMNTILSAVQKALEKYPPDNVDVTLNNETNNIDVVYHSRHNSFAITSNLYDMDENAFTKEELERELDKLGVGYVW